MITSTKILNRLQILVGRAHSRLKSTRAKGENDDEKSDEEEDIRVESFKKYEKYESCSICRLNFKENSKLRQESI